MVVVVVVVVGIGKRTAREPHEGVADVVAVNEVPVRADSDARARVLHRRARGVTAPAPALALARRAGLVGVCRGLELLLAPLQGRAGRLVGGELDLEVSQRVCKIVAGTVGEGEDAVDVKHVPEVVAHLARAGNKRTESAQC